MALHASIQTVTPAMFDAIVDALENRDRNLELIAARIVEKMVSNDNSSAVAMRFGHYLLRHIDDNELDILVTGADAGYHIGDDRFIPDAAFIRHERRQPLVKGYQPSAPDLAVEVVSPTDDEREVNDKIAGCLAAGVVVWVARPIKVQIQVFVPGKPPVTLGIDDVLEGGAVLPGFRVEVRKLFKIKEGS